MEQRTEVHTGNGIKISVPSFYEPTAQELDLLEDLALDIEQTYGPVFSVFINHNTNSPDQIHDIKFVMRK